MSKLSIIIPVYYNEGALLPLYKDMKEKALDVILKQGDDYEIIMVDDGSEDNSWEEMKQLFDMDDRITLYHLSRNFGEHPAILCGLEHCSGDCAINKAADLQEPSELILDMFSKWKEGYNVVIATRAGREEGRVQQFFANFYYGCARKFAFSNMPNGGFNIELIDRRAINVLLNMDETNTAIEGQILSLGFRTAWVPYIRKARNIGTSRWTLKKKIKCFMDMMFVNSSFPINFVGYTGGFISVLSVLMILYFLLKWVIIGEPVEGWTSLFIMILFSLGVLMISFSILGNYIWRGFEAIKRKPVFIVEDEIKHE
ncbi:MAG: glycosyltransferase family 2 protein [Lachnospiraceae bacterium]|nr:glycosyltransferase family 2 protein [Lachnospiraceae bacterium]